MCSLAYSYMNELHNDTCTYTCMDGCVYSVPCMVVNILHAGLLHAWCVGFNFCLYSCYGVFTIIMMQHELCGGSQPMLCGGSQYMLCVGLPSVGGRCLFSSGVIACALWGATACALWGAAACVLRIGIDLNPNILASTLRPET